MSTDGPLTTPLQATIRAWHGGATPDALPAIADGAAQILELDLEGAAITAPDDIAPGDRITLAFQYRNRSFTLDATVLGAREEIPDEENDEADDGADDGAGDDPGELARVVEVRFEAVPPLTAGRLASALAAGPGHGLGQRAS